MAVSGQFAKVNGDILYAEDVNMEFYDSALSSTMAYGNISVGSTVTLIKAANGNRREILIRNNGTTAIYIGPNTITTGSGYIVNTREAIVMKDRSAIYAIQSTVASNDIRYIEV